MSPPAIGYLNKGTGGKRGEGKGDGGVEGWERDRLHLLGHRGFLEMPVPHIYPVYILNRPAKL